MNIRLVAPFVHAAQQVLSQEIQLLTRVGRWSIRTPDMVMPPGIAVVVGVTGKLGGIVIYQLPTEMALGMVEVLLGEPYAQIDRTVYSAVAEMANVISGVASVELEALGFACNLAPPDLYLIDPFRRAPEPATDTSRALDLAPRTVSTLGSLSRLVAPLHTSLGILHLEVGLRCYA